MEVQSLTKKKKTFVYGLCLSFLLSCSSQAFGAGMVGKENMIPYTTPNTTPKNKIKLVAPNSKGSGSPELISNPGLPNQVSSTSSSDATCLFTNQRLDSALNNGLSQSSPIQGLDSASSELVLNNGLSQSSPIKKARNTPDGSPQLPDGSPIQRSNNYLVVTKEDRTYINENLAILTRSSSVDQLSEAPLNLSLILARIVTSSAESNAAKAQAQVLAAQSENQEAKEAAQLALQAAQEARAQAQAQVQAAQDKLAASETAAQERLAQAETQAQARLEAVQAEAALNEAERTQAAAQLLLAQERIAALEVEALRLQAEAHERDVMAFLASAPDPSTAVVRSSRRDSVAIIDDGPSQAAAAVDPLSALESDDEEGAPAPLPIGDVPADAPIEVSVGAPQQLQALEMIVEPAVDLSQALVVQESEALQHAIPANLSVEEGDGVVPAWLFAEEETQNPLAQNAELSPLIEATIDPTNNAEQLASPSNIDAVPPVENRVALIDFDSRDDEGGVALSMPQSIKHAPDLIAANPITQAGPLNHSSVLADHIANPARVAPSLVASSAGAQSDPEERDAQEAQAMRELFGHEESEAVAERGQIAEAAVEAANAPVSIEVLVAAQEYAPQLNQAAAAPVVAEAPLVAKAPVQVAPQKNGATGYNVAAKTETQEVKALQYDQSKTRVNYNPYSLYNPYAQDRYLYEDDDIFGLVYYAQTTDPSKQENEVITEEKKTEQTKDSHSNHNAHLTHSIIEHIGHSSFSITERIGDMSTDWLKHSSEVGVAAGGEIREKRVWAKGFGSNSKQKEKATLSGFKNKQRGLIIGADMDFLDEDLMLGVAYTKGFWNSKFQGKLAGDSQKVDADIGTIYGRYKATDKLFVSGQLAYGKTKISGKRRLLGQAKAGMLSTKGNIFKANLDTGYTFHLADNLAFIPKVGLAYDSLKINGFDEKVAGTSVARVGSQKASRLSGNLSASLRTKQIWKEINFVPEVHFGINHVINNSGGKMKVALLDQNNETNLTINPSKAYRTNYNVGGSVSMYKSGTIKVSVGYDYGFRPGYKNHSGYGRFEVKF